MREVNELMKRIEVLERRLDEFQARITNYFESKIARDLEATLFISKGNTRNAYSYADIAKKYFVSTSMVERVAKKINHKR